MTDAQLIEQLRHAARHEGDGSCSDLMEWAAARLEELSGAAGSPLTPGREAQIRNALDAAGDFASEFSRDLLAALDWERAHRVRAESVIQDQCAESWLHAAGVREGVARAVGMIQGVADRSNNLTERMHLGCVAGAVAASCGPALLPPHAVTHARMRRLEAALAQIVAKADALEPPGRLWQIAREALKEDS